MSLPQACQLPAAVDRDALPKAAKDFVQDRTAVVDALDVREALPKTPKDFGEYRPAVAGAQDLREALPKAPKDFGSMQQDMLQELFDDRLLNECYQQLLDGAVAQGMQDLMEGLGNRRNNSSELEWQDYVRLCRQHPLLELLHQDPFIANAYQKPRATPATPS